MHLAWKGIQQKLVLRRGPDYIQALQQKRLQRLVARAKELSPYYAEHYAAIDPQHFTLEQLPTTDKPRMMANFDRFLTDRQIKLADLEEFVRDPERLGQWYLEKYAVSRTSGTGGQQAFIVQDRAMMELLFALQMVRGSTLTRTPWATLRRACQRTRLAVVTIGRGFFPSASALAYEPEGAKSFVNRLWITHIEPLEEVVAQLNEFQPEVLLAYANVLEILAREALAGRLQGHGSLRQIINMSEPLSEGAKKLVEEAFGITVTNNYAMGECMALTTSCVQGRGMHVQADWAILEVVDRHNQPVPAGQPGEKVLMTNLYNTLQPFIRYEISDVVTLSPEPCPCGSPLPLVLRVEGRTDEVVWIKDGEQFRPVHPYVFVDMLDEFPAVGWYQITQTERNRFLLRATAAPGRHVSKEDLQQVMQSGLQRFGLANLIQMDIDVNGHVAPNPNSGKLKRISSQVGRPEEVPGSV
jgi:phenylacetate-coenzyme A ligase PaaK-like adenylate-forming protein